MSGKVVALVGAQYGSEAKGIFAAKLANQFKVHIRTGGPNAGHTFYHEGQKFVARSIPCGWVNPDAFLIIGPGAVIDLEVLLAEIKMVEDAGYKIKHRLWLDAKAGIITPAQHHGEGGINGFAHQAIGSTGEGVGLTRMARINRNSLDQNSLYDFKTVADIKGDLITPLQLGVIDTSAWVNELIDTGNNVLLEGTQGSGLSGIHGPWPYCTSADTNAGQLAVDAGISPSLVTETILVARVNPIRVAGNSGPLYGETSWEELGQPEERTTVTKKVRRVGTWHSPDVAKAVRLNRPAKLAITFLNYKFPGIGYEGFDDDWGYLTSFSEVQDWVDKVEMETGGEVVALSTNPYDSAVKPGELEYA